MIYPKRFLSEPRKRRVYEVACDLIGVYGGCLADLARQALDITAEELGEIWRMASMDMSGKSGYDYAWGGVR